MTVHFSGFLYGQPHIFKVPYSRHVENGLMGERERLLVRQAIRRFLQQSQQGMAGLVVKRYLIGKNEDLVTG